MKVLNVEIKQYTDLETVHLLAVICEYFFQIETNSRTNAFFVFLSSALCELKTGRDKFILAYVQGLQTKYFIDLNHLTCKLYKLVPVKQTSFI